MGIHPGGGVADEQTPTPVVVRVPAPPVVVIVPGIERMQGTLQNIGAEVVGMREQQDIELGMIARIPPPHHARHQCCAVA